MTFSYSTSSRMTSEFYSSYNSSKFFYNQSAYFILKKSSNFSNLSKSIFFAFAIMHDFLKSISFYQRIFLIDNWSYQYFIVSKMKNVELFMIENTNSDKRRQIVDCFYCHFVMFVDKWHYTNFLQIHFNVCSDCFCVQNYKKELKNKVFAVETNRMIKKHYYRALIRFNKKQKNNRQTKQNRLIKKRAKQQIQQTRLVEQTRIAKQNEKIRLIKKRANRLLQQQIEKARLIKKRTKFLQQQQIEKTRQVEQTRIEKKRQKTFACKRCNAKFSSNTKFHQHVQNYHQKKLIKFANEFAIITSNEFAIFTSIAAFASITFFFISKTKFVTITISKFASKAMITMFTSFATFLSKNESTLMLTSLITSQKTIVDILFSDILSITSKQSFATSIETSKKSIFWVEIVSRSVIASKSSRFSIFTFKSISTCTKTASNICSFISHQISIRKHQHQEQKFYFTIENLFEMFVEKRMISNLQHIKKIEFFSKIFYQIKIIYFFKFAINQSKSISQNSKISNSKNLNQFMFAKMSRVKFTFFIKNAFEKSIVLSYKLIVVFDLKRKIEIVKFSIFTFFSSIFRIFFKISNFRHVCRICNDIFESNNVLHRHLRAIHFSQTSRRHLKNFRECDHFDRNLENSWFLDEKTNRFFISFHVLLLDISTNELHVLVKWHNENVVIFFVRWQLLR